MRVAERQCAKRCVPLHCLVGRRTKPVGPEPATRVAQAANWWRRTAGNPGCVGQVALAGHRRCKPAPSWHRCRCKPAPAPAVLPRAKRSPPPATTGTTPAPIGCVVGLGAGLASRLLSLGDATLDAKPCHPPMSPHHPPSGPRRESGRGRAKNGPSSGPKNGPNSRFDGGSPGGDFNGENSGEGRGGEQTGGSAERRVPSTERRHKPSRSGRRVGSRRRSAGVRHGLPPQAMAALEVLFFGVLAFVVWLVWTNFG